MAELAWWEAALRLALAAGLGGAIGLERELREREAGLRTHMLVSVGAALFTLVSAYAWRDFHFSNRAGVVFDPTRIAAQVVTGIGFLGAGAIIRQGVSVRGLTTAATLWVVAAIGLASGAGYYSAAVVATVLVLFSLWPLRRATWALVERVRPGEQRLFVDLRPGAGAAAILAAVEDVSAQVQSFEVDDDEDVRHLRLDIRAPERGRARLAERLSALDEVVRVRWGR